jgi:hypothetical protein
LRSLNAVTDAAALTPFGWPIFWISLGIATLMLASAARVSAQAMAITASATVYGLGFLVVGVAVGMRYYMWTITGAALGFVLVVSELLSSRTVLSQRRVWLSVAVAVIPTCLALAARLLSGAII